MEETLKTVTLGTEDNPHVSIVRGHVDQKTFDAAFEAEGWVGGDESDIHHEYWVPLKSGAWRKSDKGKKGAVPVTVSYW